MTAPLIISVGDRFGRWIVVDVLASEPGTGRKVLCKCECGTEKKLWLGSLNSGASTKCQRCAVKHGVTVGGVPGEYQSWVAMIHRCYDPNVRSYPKYGGSGVTVCARWRESPANFIADMGERPTPRHSIDRLDNCGNYEPGNCRWATTKQQSRNRRCNKLNETAAEDVRSRAVNGESFVSIGRVYGISGSHASRVAKGKRWQHDDDAEVSP